MTVGYYLAYGVVQRSPFQITPIRLGNRVLKA